MSRRAVDRRAVLAGAFAVAAAAAVADRLTATAAVRSSPTGPNLTTPVGTSSPLVPNGVQGIWAAPILNEDWTRGLDTRLWSTNYYSSGPVSWPVNGGETAGYSTDNISIDAVNGIAGFTVKPGDTTDNGMTFPNSGAYLSTAGDGGAGTKWTAGYGYFEASIKQSGGDVWAGWWLNKFVDWPAGVEIDILETAPDFRSAAHIHHPDDHDSGSSTTLADAGSRFITYGVLVQPTGCDFYYDGTLFWSIAYPIPDVQRVLAIGQSTRHSDPLPQAYTMQCDRITVWPLPAAGASQIVWF